jgi:hypothetical protein
MRRDTPHKLEIAHCSNVDIYAGEFEPPWRFIAEAVKDGATTLTSIPHSGLYYFAVLAAGGDCDHTHDDDKRSPILIDGFCEKKYAQEVEEFVMDLAHAAS